jgi:type VI protein secretion system component VasK
LNPPAQQETPPNVVGPIWAVSLAVTLVTLIGLGLVFTFIMVVTTQHLSVVGSMMLIVILFLLVVLVVATLLIRQLSRLLSLYHKPDAQSDRSAQAKKSEIDGRDVQQIEAVREAPPDITENTTRTFDPVPRDRQTKQNVP